MFETDADRLAMIRALGGVVISTAYGSLDGLFDDEFVSVGEMAPVDSSGPTLIVRSSDAKTHALDQGIEISIDGAPYIVRGIQPDGTGMTRLQLEAA